MLLWLRNWGYKCEVCGSVIEALRETGGVSLFRENQYISKYCWCCSEKHVPVYEVKMEKLLLKLVLLNTNGSRTLYRMDRSNKKMEKYLDKN